MNRFLAHEVTPLDTEYGTFSFHCFSWGEHEEQNILVLERVLKRDFPLVRVQSACYTAEIFHSSDCDCRQQLAKACQLVSEAGGAVVYMMRDGRGAGILAKTRALRMWRESRIDTHDAYQRMGLNLDPRSYDEAAVVLHELGLTRFELLTNNPRKIESFKKMGFEVNRRSLEIAATTDSTPYLQTKKLKLGHLLEQFDAK